MKMKRISSLLTLALLSSTLWAQSDSVLTGKAAIQAWGADGDEHYRLGNYDLAASYYGLVLSTDYASADLYYNLGNCYYRTDQMGLAILYYKRALHLDPSMRDAKENLALSAILIKRLLNVLYLYHINLKIQRFILLHHQQLGEEHVGEKNHDVAHHYCIGTCFAHLNRAALNGVAVERRDARDDKCEEQRLDERKPHIPLDEQGLDAVNIGVGIDNSRYHTYQVTTKKTCRHANYH